MVRILTSDTTHQAHMSIEIDPNSGHVVTKFGNELTRPFSYIVVTSMRVAIDISLVVSYADFYCSDSKANEESSWTDKCRLVAPKMFG